MRLSVMPITRRFFSGRTTMIAVLIGLLMLVVPVGAAPAHAAELVAGTGTIPAASDNSLSTGQIVFCRSIPLYTVNQTWPTHTQAQIAYALTLLFSVKEPYVGELYNPLYLSNLSVQNVSIDSYGHATIDLTGQIVYRRGNICDAQRIKAQIVQTALHYSISGVSVRVNGVDL